LSHKINVIARLLPALSLLLALAGCGGYPQPFAGNPGATARRLAQPPPVRLAVPPPAKALLDPASAATFSSQVATALAQADVPAVAGRTRQGSQITPIYSVTNPRGQLEGTARGAAMSAEDWAAPSPAARDTAAREAAPTLVDLLTSIQARLARSDPNSLMNRSARIYFSGVSGAPGNGNVELAQQMRRQLPQDGEMVQAVPDNADFSLRGEVRLAPGEKGTQRVEIQWIVNDARGERGRVVQLNEVPAGSLNGFWGDVAAVVAQQGATGVRGVIENSARTGQPPAAAAPSPKSG
jgi:hypothetical protein